MTRFLATFIGLLASVHLPTMAQGDPAFGSVVVKGRNVKGVDKAKIPLSRKRFYLFSGGLAENKDLIDGLTTAETISRDCFYAGLKASPCFIEWLKQGNCESPFCRAVKREEIAGVPEFQAAYTKGQAAYAKRPDLAVGWLLNNMPSEITSGYYRQQRALVERLIATRRPIQSILSTAAGAEAVFAGVPVTGKSTKYVISNVLPVEIDNKVYTWACEIEVRMGKPSSLILALPLDPKRKNCVLVEKDVKVCSVGACERK